MPNSPHVLDLTGNEVVIPLRVALVGRFPPSLSGAADSVAELVQALSGYGVTVEVVRLLGPGEPPATGPPVVMDLNPLWRLSAGAAADRVGRSDVAIVHVEPEAEPAFVEDLVRRASVPVMLLVDELVDRGGASTPGLIGAMRAADAVVVRSEAARRLVAEESAGSVAAHVVPHGSALTGLDPPSRVRRRILSWGFLSPTVGAERVIRALPLLSGLDPPAEYRLVGVAHPSWSSGEAAGYRDHLLETAHRLGVADRVEFRPVLHSLADLQAEVEDCDVIAVVYDSPDRTASRILTEAVATTRPVVATRFPGAVELLAGGAGITVVHDHDAELADSQLADALRRLLTDDAAYLNAVRAARSMGPSFRWESVAARLGRLLLDIVNRSHAPSSL